MSGHTPGPRGAKADRAPVHERAVYAEPAGRGILEIADIVRHTGVPREEERAVLESVAKKDEIPRPEGL